MSCFLCTKTVFFINLNFYFLFVPAKKFTWNILQYTQMKTKQSTVKMFLISSMQLRKISVTQEHNSIAKGSLPFTVRDLTGFPASDWDHY